MKKVKVAILVSALLLSVVGCGSAPPEEVVQAYMEALSAFDAAGMAAEACPELAEAIVAGQDQVTDAGASGMVIRVADLSYETVAQQEDAAVVRVTGQVSWAGMEEEVDEDLSLVLVDGEWKLCENFR